MFNKNITSLKETADNILRELTTIINDYKTTFSENEMKSLKGKVCLGQFISQYENEWPELILSIRYKNLYDIGKMIADDNKEKFYNYFSINNYTNLKKNIDDIIMCLIPLFSSQLQLPNNLKIYTRYYDYLTKLYKESSNKDTTLEDYIFELLTYEVFPFFVKIMEKPVIQKFYLDISTNNHYQHFMSFIKNKELSFLNNVHLLKLPHKVKAFTNRYLQIIINIQGMDNYGTNYKNKQEVNIYINSYSY